MYDHEYGLQLAPSQHLELMAKTDNYGFLRMVDNWSNHRPLLFLALNLTKGNVIEFGCGDGSTPYIRSFCFENKRQFDSYDTNYSWASRCGSTCVPSWDAPSARKIYQTCSVCFIDHAPGEHRKEATKKMMHLSDLLVLHDTEIGGAGDYKWDEVMHLFKYQLHYNQHGGGAGASLVSNCIDVGQFAGLTLGNFTFDKTA